MRIADLPTILVDRVETGPEVTTIYGSFNRLDGMRLDTCVLRLCRGEYVFAELSVEDRPSGRVVAKTQTDSYAAKLRVGERYTWFNGYYQAPFVEAIADERNEWTRFEFQASDAQYFRIDDLVGWQKVGGRLRAGAIPLEVESGGWDHEHCDLCGDHIDADSPVGFEDSEGHFLCSRCFEQYGRSHDVSFMLGA